MVPPPSHLLLQNPAPSCPRLAAASLGCTTISTALIRTFLSLLPSFCSHKPGVLPSPEHLGHRRCWHRGGCGREVTDPGEGMPAPSWGPSSLPIPPRVMPLSNSQLWQHNREPKQWLDRLWLWLCLPSLAVSSLCCVGLMRFPAAQAHNAAGKPCSPAVLSHGFSGNVRPSYRFPVMLEALRCPSAWTATWALGVSQPLFPCSPQPSLGQGLATNSRNESEAGVAEGPGAHPWVSWRVCSSSSTTGDSQGITHP